MGIGDQLCQPRLGRAAAEMLAGAGYAVVDGVLALMHVVQARWGNTRYGVAVDAKAVVMLWRQRCDRLLDALYAKHCKFDAQVRP